LDLDRLTTANGAAARHDDAAVVGRIAAGDRAAVLALYGS